MTKPKHDPTEEVRKLVLQLASEGLFQSEIAMCIGVSRSTLAKYYRQELRDGRGEVFSKYYEEMFDAAKKGNLTAQIFCLQSHTNWKTKDMPDIENMPGWEKAKCCVDLFGQGSSK